MSIPKAFCTDVNRIIDIVEAHEIFFSQTKHPRKRLDFRCPDNECRQAHNAEVLGINYDKNPQEDDFVQRKHFRLKKGTTHLPTCPWAEISQALDELEREGGNKPYLSHLKKSEIINVFNPLSNDECDTKFTMDIDAGFLERIKLISDRRERINELKGYLKNALNSTSRLHEVVHCFKFMTPEEQKALSLSIPPYGEKSYRSWFRSSMYCRENEHPLIYYGAANIMEYRTGYSFKFWNKSLQSDQSNCEVFTFIKRERISKLRGAKAILDVLENGIGMQIRHHYPVDIFVFGKAVLTIERRRLDIHIDSLHSLVVMLTERGA